MIISKLEGGLGNQLFQYAMGRSAALSHHTDLKLDVEYYQKSSKRNYKLDKFNIRATIADEIDLALFGKCRKPKSWKNPFMRVSHRENKCFIEAEFDHEPGKFNFGKDAYLSGYWQNPKWFDGIREQLLGEFTLNRHLCQAAEKIADAIAHGGSVSLHVRRGDYLNPKYMGIYRQMDSDYAEKAIRRINESQGVLPTIYVFSDGIDWVKSQYDFVNPVVFVSDESLADYEELILMSLCQHNIIANSTFSWWGAWLNQNPSKIVVCPYRWFYEAHRELPDLAPDSWIKI